MAFEFEIRESKKIKGIYIVETSVSTDLRGNIWTSFIKEQIGKLIAVDLDFKHDKFSTSKKNVLRGIHGDNKSWKYVTCVFGDILQVVVDCREDSSTYLKYESFRINSDNQKMILVPPNMGNAYYVFSDIAVYHYKLAYNGDYIDANEQFSLKWNDKRININWPTNNPILSQRDK